jgi:serine/threonine protein kinase
VHVTHTYALQKLRIVKSDKVLKAFLDASPNLPDPAKELLLGCLATEPTQRLTVEKLQQHAFLKATPTQLKDWDSQAHDHPGKFKLSRMEEMRQLLAERY